MSYWQPQNIFLGVGGKEPGVMAYDIDSGQGERILLQTVGQSVYAISLSPDGGSLAAGTRQGSLYHITCDTEAENDESYSTRKLLQGAAVLSTCFLGTNNLAVSDTSGRCLIWDFACDVQPQKLLIEKGMICSMFSPGEQQLVGISSGRKLFIWNWPQKQLVQTLDIPGLPVLRSLIKPVYWCETDSWVWPGDGGKIVFYSVRHNNINTVCAHQGNVYAINTFDSQLITIGQSDGKLNCWSPEDMRPVKGIDVPKGVICATVWDDRVPKILLVNNNGKAGIYDFADGRIDFVRWLPGGDYRVVLGPDHGKCKAVLRQKMSHQARQLANQIKDRIAKSQWDGLDEFHGELVSLGYEHVSLALRAEEARNKDDIAGELESYNKLTKLYPQKESTPKKSWFKYAQLLERAWLIDEAHDVYEKFLEVYPSDYDCSANLTRLAVYSEVTERGEYIIQATLPLVSLAKSSVMLDKPFTGRYLFRALDEEKTWGINAGPASLVAKYEQIRQENSEMPLPEGHEKKIWWLSTDKKEQVGMVIFADQDSDFPDGLEFGVKFLDGGMQPMLTPVVLFNAGFKPETTSTEEHNDSVLKKLNDIHQDKDLHNKWLQVVHNSVRKAINRLTNKERAERKQKIGVSYGNSNRMQIVD